MAMEQPSWWERWTWRHPEWWSLALSLLAWLSFLMRRDGTGFSGFSTFHGHHHNLMEGMLSSWLRETASWMAMVVAMMLPLVVHCTRITANRSMWRRRHRAILLFILAYLATWMLAGLVACTVIVGLGAQGWFRPGVAAPVAFCLAAFWQVTTSKRRALVSCHRTIPLAPRGWRANADCLHYGWLIGGNCLISCGALMVACSLSGHSMAAMAGAGLIGAIERYGLRPNYRLLSVAIAGLGIICVFLLPR